MTFTIGIISDTHGLLRPKALRMLAHVDHIIHGGDIGDPEIITALRRIAPLTAIDEDKRRPHDKTGDQCGRRKCRDSFRQCKGHRQDDGISIAQRRHDDQNCDRGDILKNQDGDGSQADRTIALMALVNQPLDDRGGGEGESGAGEKSGRYRESEEKIGAKADNDRAEHDLKRPEPEDVRSLLLDAREGEVQADVEQQTTPSSERTSIMFELRKMVWPAECTASPIVK